MSRPIHFVKRPVRIAALLAGGLLVSSVAAPHAHAIISGCGGDPVVTLSDGTVVDLSATADVDGSAVRQITYTLHAPAGTSVIAVASLGVKEVLRFEPDNVPNTYDSVTRVDAPGTRVTATTITSVASATGILLGSGMKTGATNEDLALRVGP